MITQREYKKSGIFLPLMGFGMMRLPLTSQNPADIDEAKALAMIDRAYQAGIRYFDTAVPYHGGKSEEFVGRALAKYPRDSFVLADKLPLWSLSSLDEAKEIFNSQLKKCRVEYFDHYLLHSLQTAFWSKAEKLGLYDFLADMKAAGKIKRLGFSFHDTPEVLRTIADAHPWDFAQIQLNFFDWEHYRSREQYEVLTERGIPVVIMEPLRGGALGALSPAATAVFKKYNPDVTAASWSFRFAASLPNVITVLSGMTYMEHLEDNIGTMTDFKPLTDEERGVIDEALMAYYNSCSVPCTSCRYCSVCPQGIDMPNIFYLYNQLQMTGDKARYTRKMGEMPESVRPDRCLSCGKCMKYCPQHIDIPAALRKTIAALG